MSLHSRFFRQTQTLHTLFQRIARTALTSSLHRKHMEPYHRHRSSLITLAVFLVAFAWAAHAGEQGFVWRSSLDLALVRMWSQP